uniref:Uncharacterized protein n=1 Tax=Rhizophora mucronata TaxID=61149 RepID=A0A2P2ITD1_RHIMU
MVPEIIDLHVHSDALRLIEAANTAMDAANEGCTCWCPQYKSCFYGISKTIINCICFLS